MEIKMITPRDSLLPGITESWWLFSSYEAGSAGGEFEPPAFGLEVEIGWTWLDSDWTRTANSQIGANRYSTVKTHV